jgi:hypothetical protein
VNERIGRHKVCHYITLVFGVTKTEYDDEANGEDANAEKYPVKQSEILSHSDFFLQR